jgi:alkane 1-monooxygenase
MKDSKYLLAYIIPLSVGLSYYLGGIWSFSGFFIAFVIIPIVEFFHKGTTENLTIEEEDTQLKKNIFDFILYINVPIIWGLLVYFFYTISQGGHALWELVGMTVSTGILLGGNGIGIGHELGHRDTWYERLFAKMLLLPSFYMHFIIEHNHGHHKWISTNQDPASSRFNENIYAFFVRSSVMGYVSAWKISGEQTRRKGHSTFHPIYNSMIGYSFLQLTYVVTIVYVFGWITLPFIIAAGVLGFLLLECVNYIEHYGLRRKKLPSGRYESVKPHHSWNSNHELGRIFLYEVTRHSDHHFKANRKYQILRHFDETPQLPHGYPGSILIALIPPLWFSYMNPKVEEVRQQFDMI